MVGNNRGPFGSQCTKLWFSWMSGTWSLVCINIELESMEGGKFLSKTAINRPQNRCVIKYVTVKVDTRYIM